MDSARATYDAPNEGSEEHRLSDAIDICSELAASASIQHLCKKAVCLITQRLSSSNAAILLDSSAPDSEDPFWGIGENGEPILNESDAKEYKSEGPHLLSPLTTHDGIHLGKLITGATEFHDHQAEQLPEIFRMVASFLSVRIENLCSEHTKDNEFLTLVDALPNSIYIKDTESRILLANKQMAAVWGTTPEKMIGKTDHDHFPPEFAQKFYADEQQIIQSGIPLVEREETGLYANGDPRWTLTSKIPIKDDQGRVFCLMGIGVDITEMKKNEFKLTESKERFQSLFQSIGDAIIAHDEQGRILDFNSTAFDLFDLSDEEGQQKTMHSINLPEYTQLMEQGLAENHRLKAEYSTPFGNQLDLDIRISEFTYAGQLAYMALMRDVTELEKAKQEAEDAARSRSAFLANMSHEIRTPLNAVIGMTDLIKVTDLNDEQYEFASTIQTSGELLLDIINSILDLSKIEAGQMFLEEAPFCLRSCIENALDLVVNNASKKPMELTYDLHGDLPNSFVGDEIHLRQVLLNLLSNAIKFTEEGEVVVRVGGTPIEDGRYRLNFSVTDTGIGMTEEQADIIFNPFQQADPSTTRKYGGTGLGLSICNGLVEMMDGDISVQTEPGKGSKFMFHIHLRAAEDQISIDPAFDEEVLQGKRILIVDDNLTNLTILKAQLQRWGMTVMGFDSGAAALSSLHQLGKIDLAILDMLMPEMDGLGLARRLRDDALMTHKPIMILSSVSKPQDLSPELVDTWLHKPAKFQLLGRSLCNMVAKHKTMSLSPRVLPDGDDLDLGRDHPLRILIAEDNRVNQAVIKKQLAHLGYTADLVENGLLAVEAACSRTYDLILMDIQMPVLDGLEATDRIVAAFKGRPAPAIVALTAHAMPDDRERGMKRGMFGYVTKPVRLEAMTEALKSITRLDD